MSTLDMTPKYINELRAIEQRIMPGKMSKADYQSKVMAKAPLEVMASFQAINERAYQNLEISLLAAGREIPDGVRNRTGWCGVIMKPDSKPRPLAEFKKQLAVAKAQPKPKGVEIVASASATASRPTSARTNVSGKPIHVPANVVANLKGFRGPDAGMKAFDAAAELKARVGLRLNRRDSVAEWHCMKNLGMDIQAIATEGVGTSGGNTVESPLYSAIIELQARVSIARRLATVLPMASEGLLIPKIAADSLGAIKYPGEAGTIDPGDVNFGQIELLAKKRALFAFASAELASDTVINYTDFLVRRFGYGLAVNEDREFALGDGTSNFGTEVGLAGAIEAGGIYQAASGHDTWPGLDVDDFVGCMGRLPEWAADGREAWVCSAAFYAIAMLGAVGGNSQGFDADGNPLFLGKPVFFLTGLPTTTAAATVCCYYGNFEEGAIIGDRLPFSLAVSEHAGFGNDTVAFRGLTRYDISIHEGGDATDPGAIVALKTAA